MIEIIDDKIVLNEDFKKNVAIPYFKDIYKDLVAQSDAKSKGINKVSILNVSLIHPPYVIPTMTLDSSQFFKSTKLKNQLDCTALLHICPQRI